MVFIEHFNSFLAGFFFGVAAIFFAAVVMSAKL
jgi:hypothetical protein